MIGDGWGFNQILAANYFKYGEAGKAPFEQFPVKLALSTYSAFGGYNPELAWKHFSYRKNEPTDSAAAATALATGMKTYDAAIGVDIDRKPLRSFFEAAEDAGKSTGVVSSVPFTHATPASFVAHNAARADYIGIAEEMIQRSRADVIMGGGNPFYDDSGKRVKTDGNYRFVGSSQWEALNAGKAGGDADGDGSEDKWKLIQTREEFQKLAQGKDLPKRVIGVPQVASTLQQGRAASDGTPKDDLPFQTPLTETVPTLTEMAQGALNVLNQDADGFGLMIECGAIDWSGHSNNGGRLIEEMLSYNDAVQAVVDWVEANSSWEETLLIVTGDHETGYLTGPDASAENWTEPVNEGIGKMPRMTFNTTDHTNQLIPFFAIGASSSRFTEQATLIDPKRGPYIDNTLVGKIGHEVLGGTETTQ